MTASVSTFVAEAAHAVPVGGAARRRGDRRRASRCCAASSAAAASSFKWHDAALSWLEGVFSRGDRRLADVLGPPSASAPLRRLVRPLPLDLWEQAFAENGLDPDFYLRRRPLDETLPWDHLDAGVSKRFLQRELARASRAR